MKESVENVLNELEIQSSLEKSRKVDDIIAENRMLAITKETGEMLNMILRLNNVKNMLEVGTSTGYSTIWCAEAISDNLGEIITIEQNPNKIKRTKENFQKSELSDKISIKEGLAIKTLEELNSQKKYQGFFDFVFIDADKENVIKYFNLIFPMVSINGIIVTDNMLYPEKYRPYMKKFSNYLKTNHRLRTITSPIGNDEEITIKIK